jgi:putative ABC transport system permease protein
VVVSDRFWRRRLAADAAAVGREVVLGGEVFRVVGVLPAEFDFALDPADVWRPMPVGADGGGPAVRVIARLATDRSAEDLRRALEQVPDVSSEPEFVRVTALTDEVAGDSARTLGLLAGAAALALLTAFANLAVILMVRAIDRRRELGIRQALGAHPSDATRLLTLEALALVGLGSVGGILAALWATPVVASFALEVAGATGAGPGVSWRAVLTCVLVAVFCAGASGLLASLPARRGGAGALRTRGTSASREELALRRLLVVGEVALAFVLLLSMSVLGGSLEGMLRTDPGFRADGVLKLQLSLPSARYPTPERVAAFYRELQGALFDRLGEGSVAVVDEIPLSGDGGRTSVGVRPEAAEVEAVVRTASADYFRVLGIPVVAGRTFAAAGPGDAPIPVVISESVAARIFGSESAVGRSVWVAAVGAPAEVVGVVGDVKHRALDEPLLATVYVSADQFPSASSNLVVRSGVPAPVVIASVREEVQALDADLPVYRVREMAEVLDASPGVPVRRLLTSMLVGFALLAVALSAIGLFGVAGHDLARRRPELALRVALGAGPVELVGRTLGESVGTVAAGLVVGAGLAVVAIRALGDMGTPGGFPGVLGLSVLVAAVLALVCVAAVLPAAVRASRSDPVSALRGD